MTRFTDVTLDMNLFDRLDKTFVGPTRELWKLVMPELSNLHRKPKTRTKMKYLLQVDRVKNEFREDHHSWALLALDKAQKPQEITLLCEIPSAAPGSRLKLIAARREARDLQAED
jgi:hypothetical protein